MPPTLEDVGRNCGVSRSTVSRVINNSPLVNPETREKVLKAIKQLGYAPNFIARSLTTNRTETIGITIPDIAGGVFPEIIAGVDEIASRRGYHLLVAFLGGPRSETITVDDLIRHRRVDAIICVATVDDEYLTEMAQYGVPIVRAAKQSPVASIPSVLFDDCGGAKKATRLLIERGCRNIVHIRGPVGTYDADERSHGFKAALKEAGIEFRPEMELPGTFMRQSGRAAVEKALAEGLEFDGLFVGNDDMAIGAMEVLGEKGISIPDQVAVVGFDDIDAAKFIGLSTVRVPIRDLGRTAAELAFQFVDSKTPVESKVLGTEVIERASTRRGESLRPIEIRNVSE